MSQEIITQCFKRWREILAPDMLGEDDEIGLSVAEARAFMDLMTVVMPNHATGGI